MTTPRQTHGHDRVGNDSHSHRATQAMTTAAGMSGYTSQL